MQHLSHQAMYHHPLTDIEISGDFWHDWCCLLPETSFFTLSCTAKILYYTIPYPMWVAFQHKWTKTSMILHPGEEGIGHTGNIHPKLQCGRYLDYC